MWKFVLLLLSPLLLVVLTDDGICIYQERVLEYIDLKEGPTPRARLIPIEICCRGYRNNSGTCEPICEPECTLGTCVAPNKCKCNDGWFGDTCQEALSQCVDGYWGPDCLTACDCNGSKCTENGTCTCQAGYTGEKCEMPCSNETFGENCSQFCDCLNGNCDPGTGHCSCYPGYTGNNCSTTCSDGKYGADCTETCRCQNNSTCDKADGHCVCQSEFEGEFCEKSCSLGINCLNTCDCGSNPCDPKTGTCFCKPGFIGQQCEDTCEEGYCGDQCAKSCNCINGQCSNTDCVCTCNDGWTGENCNDRICAHLKYGADCTKTCVCDPLNTERCDSLSGSCVCKSPWTGDCSERCPFNSFGPNCSEKCSCNRNNTNFCNNGICACKPGWFGTECDEPCEPGYFGENCSSICLYFGLVNYRCDPIQGDVCNSNYKGKDCEVCNCEPNRNCNVTTGACDCKPGYSGDECSLFCPKNTFGENCDQPCECEDCRKTDGYCKCQKGWKGRKCSDYCPIQFYDKITRECIDQSGVFIPLDNVIYFLICGIIILLIVIFVIIYYKCKRPSYDGMVNLHAPKITLAPPSIPSSNTYEREDHHYETIPEGPIASNYNTLLRADEVYHRFHDPAYYNGYERPTFQENIQMYTPLPGYVRLDRNSIGPGPPRQTNNFNRYYTFGEQRL